MSRTYNKTFDLGNLFESRAANGGGSGSYSGGMSVADFKANNWYSRLVDLGSRYKARIRRYDQMDMTVDISRALDIIAEDISSDNADDEETFILNFDHLDNPRKTDIRTSEKVKRRWQARTNLDTDFFEYVRRACKYGIALFEVNKDGSFKELHNDGICGYILDDEDRSKVTHYIYDEESIDSIDGDFITGTYNTVTNKVTNYSEKIKAVNDLMIIKIGKGPLGTSILENVYRTWRQLQLLEDAAIIYRIVRAPERRVFYINTGRLQGARAERHMRRIKSDIQQRQTARNNELETEYNPTSIQEDFYIAEQDSKKGSRVETLQGGQAQNITEELTHFNKKLALGLRVPAGYMESVYSDNNQRQQPSDDRIGTMYQSELRYAGYIRRVQKQVAKPLFANFKQFSKSVMSYTIDPLVEFEIAAPQSFAVYKENELFSTLLNTVNSATNSNLLGSRFILKKFLHLTEEEIGESEYSVMYQKGLSDEQIKKLEAHEVENLCYGDGKLASEKLGIEIGDSKGGGFGRF